MAAQREKFLAGAHERKVPQRKAEKIFDLMAEFAGYGFNKSHSCAYALLAYQTAYLKVHYPVEFMAALLTSEIGKTEKLVRYIHENYRDTAVMVVTGYASVDGAVTAMHSGADEYLGKPYTEDELLTAVQRALGRPSRVCAVSRVIPSHRPGPASKRPRSTVPAGPERRPFLPMGLLFTPTCRWGWPGAW